MFDLSHETEEQALYRREALGAFVHEARTPLTSIRMVLELAGRQSGDDGLVLDRELVGMLNASLADLQRLVDDLHETSRLERGRAMVTEGPSDLREAVEVAEARIGPALTLVHDEIPSIVGPWDESLLARAIAGFADTANRAGEGSGTVSLAVTVTVDAVEVVLRSGEPSAVSKGISADVGFAFFRSRQFVQALRGSVSFQRADRFASITMTLPRA